MNVSFHLYKDDATYTATAFSKVVNKFLGEDICQYKENTDLLMEKLLLVKDTDFHLSSDQKVINQMKEHTSICNN